MKNSELTNQNNLTELYSNWGEIRPEVPQSELNKVFQLAWDSLGEQDKSKQMIFDAKQYLDLMYKGKKDAAQAIKDKYSYIGQLSSFEKRITMLSTFKGSLQTGGKVATFHKHTFTKDFILKGKAGDKVLFRKGATVIGRAEPLKDKKSSYIRVLIRSGSGTMGVFGHRYFNIPIEYFTNQKGIVASPVQFATPPKPIDIPADVIADIPPNLIEPVTDEPVTDNEPSDVVETEKIETKKTIFTTKNIVIGVLVIAAIVGILKWQKVF